MAKYDQKSLKAEEFINDEEIRATLEYAEANKNNAELIDRILEKARPVSEGNGCTCAGLTHREASVLLACEIHEKIQKMYEIAEEIKLAFYGNRIVLFAPLYLSNYCVNGCLYCPYHLKNKHIARKKLTQEELASRINVTCKAVSKWETGRGFPDISLLEILAKALDISVIELLSGENIRNRNRSFDMRRGKVYACPVCGNTVMASGDALVCCCGITLPALECEDDDPSHEIRVELSDGEYCVSVAHEMSKDHYISFIAAVSSRGVQFAKLYPEEDALARFRIDGVEKIYAFCNRHGLFCVKP